jgi:hypothetical protein
VKIVGTAELLEVLQNLGVGLVRVAGNPYHFSPRDRGTIVQIG